MRELKKVKRMDLHLVKKYGKYDACARCGRKTLADNDLRSKQHQWAPLCRALPTFAPYLYNGHDLT